MTLQNIDYLLNKKKVSESSTPGHTKHFQTIYLEFQLLINRHSTI